MPATFTVSEASVSATMDGLERRFRDVSVQGEADAAWGMWGDNGTQSNFAWMVTVASGEPAISLPTLPDSILSLLGVDPQTLQPMYIGIDDYDPVQGYDEYAEFSSRMTNPSIYSRCNGLYQYVLNGGFASPEEMERMREKWMPNGISEAWWMLGMPGRPTSVNQ